MKLVKIAYGNDDPTESAQETQALLQAYPEPEGHHLPDDGRRSRPPPRCSSRKEVRKVALTGLGLPNEMRKYVKAGCATKFGLWNESDFGYLAAYVAHDVLAGKLTGKIGETFKAGKLGTFKVVVSDGNKPVVVLGPPLVFTPQNIDKFHF